MDHGPSEDGREDRWKGGGARRRPPGQPVEEPDGKGFLSSFEERNPFLFLGDVHGLCTAVSGFDVGQSVQVCPGLRCNGGGGRGTHSINILKKECSA
jgi:hypothetical protein